MVDGRRTVFTYRNGAIVYIGMYGLVEYGASENVTPA